MIYLLRADRSFFLLIGVLIAVVVGVVAHDTVLGLVGRALGDPLPRRGGVPTWRPRLTPYGIVAAVLAIWTWTKPVPLATYPSSWKPKATVALVMGPVTYFALAALVGLPSISLTQTSISNVQAIRLGAETGLVLLTGASLLPVPPADLGRIIFVWAPTRGGWQTWRERLVDGDVGSYILLAVALLPALLTALPDLVRDLTGPLVSDLLRSIGR